MNGTLDHILLVLGKDLKIEWRSRARISALLIFSLSTLLIFSFALGPDVVLLRKNAGGYFWLALLFASVLSLSESLRIEGENSALEGLLLIPIDARAIFVGKALGNAILMGLLALVIWPVTIALFDVTVGESPLLLALVTTLGSLAISAPGTLYSTITLRARSRDVLLPVLLFPMLIPAILAAVKATERILDGDPMNQANSWLALLAGFAALYWALGFVLFPRVAEDR